MFHRPEETSLALPDPRCQPVIAYSMNARRSYYTVSDNGLATRVWQPVAAEGIFVLGGWRSQQGWSRKFFTLRYVECSGNVLVALWITYSMH